MSDADDALKSLRERLAGSGEDRLGSALSDLLENPLFTGAVACAFDARELAIHTQEMAMTLLNIPSASDIERLTRRLRSLSQRMEGVEDALYRMESLLAGGGVDARLSSIERQLTTLLDRRIPPPAPRAGPTAPQVESAPKGQPPRRAQSPPRARPATRSEPAQERPAAPPAQPSSPSDPSPKDAPRPPRPPAGRTPKAKDA